MQATWDTRLWHDARDNHTRTRGDGYRLEEDMRVGNEEQEKNAWEAEPSALQQQREGGSRRRTRTTAAGEERKVESFCR